MIIKDGKVINRGLTPKEGCNENSTGIAGSAITLFNKLTAGLNHESNTHKCCSWSCCNYNITIAELSSPPGSAPNISSDGLVWQSSCGCFFTYSANLIIVLLLIFISNGQIEINIV